MKTSLRALVAIGLLASSSQIWSEVGSATPDSGAKATFARTNDLNRTEPASSPAKVQNPRRPTRSQPAVPQPSAVVLAIVSMSRAGVESSVIETYVQETDVPWVRPDEVVFLHNQRVAPPVITALLKRSNELRSQQAQAIRDAQERWNQQRADEAARIAAQNPARVPGSRSFHYGQSYGSAPPAYNWGNQFYSYPYAIVPVYPYSSGRSMRNPQPPPAPSVTPTPGNAGAPNPDSSSFFTSRWQWNGSTGKPIDLR